MALKKTTINGKTYLTDNGKYAGSIGVGVNSPQVPVTPSGRKNPVLGETTTIENATASFAKWLAERYIPDTNLTAGDLGIQSPELPEGVIKLPPKPSGIHGTTTTIFQLKFDQRDNGTPNRSFVELVITSYYDKHLGGYNTSADREIVTYTPSHVIGNNISERYVVSGNMTSLPKPPFPNFVTPGRRRNDGTIRAQHAAYLTELAKGDNTARMVTWAHEEWGSSPPRFI